MKCSAPAASRCVLSNRRLAVTVGEVTPTGADRPIGRRHRSGRRACTALVLPIGRSGNPLGEVRLEGRFAGAFGPYGTRMARGVPAADRARCCAPAGVRSTASGATMRWHDQLTESLGALADAPRSNCRSRADRRRHGGAAAGRRARGAGADERRRDRRRAPRRRTGDHRRARRAIAPAAPAMRSPAGSMRSSALQRGGRPAGALRRRDRGEQRHRERRGVPHQPGRQQRRARGDSRRCRRAARSACWPKKSAGSPTPQPRPQRPSASGTAALAAEVSSVGDRAGGHAPGPRRCDSRSGSRRGARRSGSTMPRPNWRTLPDRCDRP